MTKENRTIPIPQIILNEEIYPRARVDPRRVSMFAENMRDGFEIEPIEVQIHPQDWCGRMDIYLKEKVSLNARNVPNPHSNPHFIWAFYG